MDVQKPQRWPLIVSLFALAAVIGALVLMELQMLDLQKSVADLSAQPAAEDSDQIVAEEDSAIGDSQLAGTSPEPVEVYTNNDLGYKVSIDPETTVREYQDDVLFGGENQFDIRRSGDGQSIKIFSFLDAEVTGTTNIDGYSATISESATGYCDGPGCGAPYVAYSMLKDGYEYHIVFYGDTQISESEATILGSFEFLR